MTKFMVCIEVKGPVSKDKFDSAMEHSTAREALGEALQCDVSLQRCEDNYLAQKVLPERNRFMAILESLIRTVEATEASGGIRPDLGISGFRVGNRKTGQTEHLRSGSANGGRPLFTSPSIVLSV